MIMANSALLFLVAIVILHLNSGDAFQCTSGPLIDDDKVCDFKADCTDGSDELTCPVDCGFETSDLCHWTQDQSDDIDWTWFDVNTIYHDYKGPVTDHTTETSAGHYLFVDGTTSGIKDKARLISPVYKMAPRGCTFNMWFYMFGPEYGDLEVKLLDDSGENHVTKVQDNALQYYKWYFWQSQISPCTKNFQVVIESEDKLQVPVESGFALDDVSFTDCEFPDQVAVGQCASGYRQCGTGECYLIERHCDMELDCCDLTDESNCDQQGYSQCDFENGICDWEQLVNDEFDWTWQQGGTPDNWRRTGPQYDHTTGTTEGWYIYTESSDRRRNGDRAIIVSYPIVGITSGKQCSVRFFYHMEGQGIGTLNVYTRTAINGPLTLLWSEDKQLGEQWNYASLELNEQLIDFQVVFEGVMGFTAESDIGLDDISFTPDCTRTDSLPEVSTPDGVFCIPEELPCNGNTCIDRAKYCDFKQDCEDDNEDEKDCPDSCDFERDLCSWLQDDTDDIDWSVYTSRTVPGGYKGPATDHTTETAQGRYIYVDGSTSRTGQKARLISPQYKLAPRGCHFNMWFYMFGPEYGDLEVKLVDDTGEDHVTKVLDNALQYNVWYFWDSQIRTCSANFQVVIESEDKLQVPIESGFAVDDLFFTDCAFTEQVDIGTCPSDMMQCGTRECYPADQHCDMELDCCDMTDETNCESQGYIQCDFEQGMCDELEQLTTDEFDWTWQQGGTPDNWRRTGPQFDHTKGNQDGWYYYTESSQRRKNGERARLATFAIAATTTGSCVIRFFYHMEGQGIGTLNVYTRQAVNGPLEKLWSKDKSLGEQWNYANLQLKVSNDFQVIFEVVVGFTAESDIGLDDVSFTPDCLRSSAGLPVSPTEEITTPKRNLPTLPSCLQGKFTCTADGSCIDQSWLCDGRNDCPDSQDEASCPTSGNSAMVIGLSVTFGLLFLAAAAGGIFYYVRIYSKKNQKLISNEMTPGMVNPSYEHNTVGSSSLETQEAQA